MNNIELLISAKWTLPIAPHNTILEQHAVAISHGEIIDVLPLETAKEQYYADEYLDLKNHVLMPGLVNTHTHTPMTLFRGLADDLDLMDWLQNHIWPAETALLNEESVTVGTRLAIAEMLRGGTTCFNDHYFYHDIIAQTCAEEKIRARVGLLVLNVPTGWASDEAAYLKRVEDTLKQGKTYGHTNWALAPHAPYTVSDDAFKRLNELSKEYNLPIHLHLHETAFEIEQSVKEFGKRPIQRLHELDLLHERLIAVHMTQLNDDEIKLLRDNGVHIAHCPESNLKLASGIASTPHLLDHGVNVAIGTDGAASNNDLDMFGELRTASLIAKVVNHNPRDCPADQALKMATLNGAKALGLEHLIGSIEKGKQADLIAIDMSDTITQPVFNVMSHLTYAVNRRQVSDVWIAGKRLLKNHQFMHLDIEQTIQQAHQWADKARQFSLNDHAEVASR